MNRLLDTPLGRKTVVRDTAEGFTHLRSVYSDSIMQAIAEHTKR